MKNQPVVRSRRFRVGLFVLAWVLVFCVFFGYRLSKALNDPDEGNVYAAKAKINGLTAALLDYRFTCGSFPTTEQGLDALVAKPSRPPACTKYPNGAVLADGKIPKDPWDNLFVYASDGKTFTLTSLGRDGKEGGEGYDADIQGSSQK